MSDEKIPLIFCTDGIFPHMVGGIQRHSRLLAEELALTGLVSLTVIHPHEGITVFDPELGIEEKIIPEEKSSKRYLINCYRYSGKVLDYLKTRPGTVIYAQGLAVWKNMGSLKERIILNPHGLEPFQGISFRDRFMGLPFRLILKYQFRNAEKVVSLGGRLTKILESLTKPGHVAVLPNAVNVHAVPERDFNHLPVRFLFVGRFAFNKGINILLKAVSELNSEGYDQKIVFNLVGKGPLFKEYSENYKLPNLHFLGFASDEKLNELYASDDVFVLPTLFEGMPTVVLEAMAKGMPVIVTDTGATTEMVDDANGYIIHKKDVDSLKSALLNYLNLLPEKRKKLSENAYIKVKNNFTWKIVAERHISVFREVYKKAGKNR